MEAETVLTSAIAEFVKTHCVAAAEAASSAAVAMEEQRAAAQAHKAQLAADNGEAEPVPSTEELLVLEWRAELAKVCTFQRA